MPTVKELREAKLLSQDDLAKMAKISPATLNRIEKGYQKPMWVTRRKLAKALKVKAEIIQFDVKASCETKKST
jgi:DNA-binding XRE family transcriptional regulator